LSASINILERIFSTVCNYLIITLKKSITISDKKNLNITLNVALRLSSANFFCSYSNCFCFISSFSFSNKVTRSFFLTKIGLRRGPVSSSDADIKLNFI